MRHVPALLILLAMLAACGAPTPGAGTGGAPAITSTTLTASSAGTNTIGSVGGAPPAASTPVNTGAPTELTVFAAASLTEAFTTLGKTFDAANNTRTTFNFAGSQQLAQQIVQGAPTDVFASANQTRMKNVIEAGLIISGTQQAFVRNRLVIVYPIRNPANIATLADLARPGVKLVLADKVVPAGQYALDMLNKAAQAPKFAATYNDAVLANVVSYEENVRAVLSKVALGEADAGIVYASDISPAVKAQVGQLVIPDSLNTIATYPIAAITNAPHTSAAQQFIAYVLSPEGQQTLVSYGFLPGRQ